MDLGLKGLHALVAGSSRGLGFALARTLASEGCQVAINSRNEIMITAAASQLSAETGSRVIGLAGDLANPQTPAQLVEQTAATFGGLDLLVTNSGGPPSGKFETLEDSAWQQAIELILLSHVRMIRAALPLLRQSASPSVLTMTSYSVKQPVPNLVLSNSVRAATVGLTKSLAIELGSEGIRFNSILPGWTDTERVQELMGYRARINNTSMEDEIAKQAKDSPLGRMGSPQEFANAAAFLLSPAASYITGVMLNVDGGMYKGTL